MLLSFVFLCQLKRNIFYSPNIIVGIVNSKFFLEVLFTFFHCLFSVRWIILGTNPKYFIALLNTSFAKNRHHFVLCIKIAFITQNDTVHYNTYIIHYILTHEFWAVWLLLFHYILALNAFSHPLFIAINFIVLIKDPLHEIHTW